VSERSIELVSKTSPRLEKTALQDTYGDSSVDGERGPEALARELMARASSAPDPAPLLAAAQALLEQAEGERQAVPALRLKRG
jgi:hypothetical protein